MVGECQCYQPLNLTFILLAALKWRRQNELRSTTEKVSNRNTKTICNICSKLTKRHYNDVNDTFLRGVTTVKIIYSNKKRADTSTIH